MAQHQLTPGPLLDEQGNLVEAGYATSLVKAYNRAAIKAPAWRIKEWDYYYIGNQKFGLALTVADNGYHSLYSITVLDFEKKTDITKSIMDWFTLGKIGLPSTSMMGDVNVSDEKRGFSFSFVKLDGKKRRLTVNCKDFGKKKEFFHCDVYLEETVDGSMVIATPFKKKAHFYYNQKINCMSARGYMKVGDTSYDFLHDSYAVLDWGRGVWTYKNTWYWSSLNTIDNGHVIGWNLGYGFGDTSAASENMFFFDGKAYKLEDVKMDIPMGDFGKDDFMAPWTFRSEKGDIKLVFTPVYDRHSDTYSLLFRCNQHQVFGLFSGTIEIDGQIYEIHQRMGFAEKVYNRW